MREIEKTIKCCISGHCTGCPRQVKNYPAGRADCKDLLYGHIIGILRDEQERDSEIERLKEIIKTLESDNYNAEMNLKHLTEIVADMKQ